MGLSVLVSMSLEKRSSGIIFERRCPMMISDAGPVGKAHWGLLLLRLLVDPGEERLRSTIRPKHEMKYTFYLHIKWLLIAVSAQRGACFEERSTYRSSICVVCAIRRQNSADFGCGRTPNRARQAQVNSPPVLSFAARAGRTAPSTSGMLGWPGR